MFICPRRVLLLPETPPRPPRAHRESRPAQRHEVVFGHVQDFGAEPESSCSANPETLGIEFVVKCDVGDFAHLDTVLGEDGCPDELASHLGGFGVDPARLGTDVGAAQKERNPRTNAEIRTALVTLLPAKANGGLNPLVPGDRELGFPSRLVEALGAEFLARFAGQILQVW